MRTEHEFGAALKTRRGKGAETDPKILDKGKTGVETRICHSANVSPDVTKLGDRAGDLPAKSTGKQRGKKHQER